MCIYRHSSQYIDADRAKERKEMGQKWMLRDKENFPRANLDTRAIISLALL
jgi:hypothetical protein